jgi:protein SMG7
MLSSFTSNFWLLLIGPSFRAACVHTIFLDLQLAAAEKVDSSLWQLHAQVNTEYRKILSRLKNSQHVVVKRKLEKHYIGFLRTSQHFYKAYIQRLDARYEIRELHRVVQGINVEKMTIPDRIEHTPLALRQIVLKSCHQTLIHLGDLARYRAQQQRKGAALEGALTCYLLAHDLIPTSGYAHHQMGIVQLDDKKHLDIIYHFYRAWAIQEPHPNARQNLESEFRSLLLPSAPSRRSGPLDPQEAFVNWFAKLHAHLYQGEAFTQHQELEDEVIHRLGLATKEKNSAETLLKMVLINIAAYYVANQRLRGMLAPGL